MESLTVSYFTVSFCSSFVSPDGDCQAAKRNFSSNHAFPVARGEFLHVTPEELCE